MKIICADTVLVRLSYDANCKWHMSIWEKICDTEQKYMSFLGPSPSAISGKNSKARESIPKDAMLRSAFSVERAFWVFYQDSRIRVKRCVPCVFWGFALLKGTRSMIDPTSIKSTHPKISKRMVQNKFFRVIFFCRMFDRKLTRTDRVPAY